MLGEIVARLAAGGAETRTGCELLVDLAQTRDLSIEEAATLARAIAASGSTMRFAHSDRCLADVPSTGAPGSLSTLLCPYLVASCGIRVPKISASGSVAGGIDTLALLPGFRDAIEESDANLLLENVGIFHTLQSKELCPADRVLIDVRRERGMMANPSLAAVSLLSKKLTVPGTHAVFDFRVGSEGNIGMDFSSARRAATFFMSVARELGISVAVVLTDNRDCPTSAIGRLESLRLLLDALSCSTMTAIDRRHIEVCIDLAARAVALAREQSFGKRHRDEVASALSEGVTLRTFRTHVLAQGATIAPDAFLVSALSAQKVEPIVASEGGLWFPPPLAELKRFSKALAKAGDGHVGYRMAVEPGSQVDRGQVVAEVRTRAGRTEGYALQGTIAVGVHHYRDPEAVEVGAEE